MTHYLHHVPGRLRIKNPAFKRSEGKAHAALEALTGIAGVKSAHVNETTGSLLVHYDPSVIDSAAILRILDMEDQIETATAALAKVSPNRGMDQMFSRAGEALGGLGKS